MLGAIAGDVIGSRFEHAGIKSKDFALFNQQSVFTDDTVLTVAVAYSILTGRTRTPNNSRRRQPAKVTTDGTALFQLYRQSAGYF